MTRSTESSSMADQSAREKTCTNRRPPNEEDPFTSLRRHADQQISSVLDFFLSSFPSRFAHLQHRQSEHRIASGKRDAEEGRRGVEEDAGSASAWSGMQPSYEILAMLQSLLPRHTTENMAPAECHGYHSDRGRGLPPEAFDQCPSTFESQQEFGGHLDSIDYLYRSPYAPLRLENDHTLGPKLDWRAAYEDLLLARQGLWLPSRKILKGFQPGRRPEAYRDWIRSLQDSDMLPSDTLHCGRYHHSPILAALEALHGAQNKFDRALDEATGQDWYELARAMGCDDSYRDDQNPERELPETELDAYEQFIGHSRDPDPMSELKRQILSPGPPAPDVSTKPSVVATIIRTERSILADGSVTTRTSSKRRFADGSEESSETLERARDHAERLVVKEKEHSNENESVDKRPQTGSWSWFWK